MKRRACIVVASEMTLRVFLARQIAAMAERYDVTVVVKSPTPGLSRDLGDVTVRPLAINRNVSPLQDLWCLVALVRLMRAERFDLVQSMTPKAGLLAMSAAWLARVPVRVHTFTGQVWATRTGVQRQALKLLDRVIARAATFTLADSPSQRAFLAAQGVVPATKVAVLGKGSVSGVDISKFRPDPLVRRTVRASLGIAATDIVLLFVGRLHRDKGILDLAQAFATLADHRADVCLLVVGPDEQNLSPAMRELCGRHQARVLFCPYTHVPEQYMAAADVLCLPSYREGFGSVIIEAAAAGLPAVASRIYGVVDAIVENTTGLLHEPRDVTGLMEQLQRLTVDPQLRLSLGAAARERAARDFSPGALTSAVLDVYARLLDGVPPRRFVMASSGGWYSRYGKRVLDVIGAGLGLVLLLPVMFAVALLIVFSLGSPVLFRQKRPGLHAVPFTMVKFRSMADALERDGTPLPDDERLTAVGRLLRAASLDELPELWNVLRGDMSLVGPRPLLMQYLELYSPRQARRHDVRPGITGLAQVSGRNGLSWSRRFELDVEYVERCSLLLDLGILARTAWAVISRRGVAQPGRATVDYFQGNVAGHG
jgi:lipopolysaccharide/colanic/teichoic acid biosynthesis glycosyltransferase/glycosyltransferase involved in cell wall biosynthesis